MKRIELFVSPEDYGEVEARGAGWDPLAKCWYLDPGASLKSFSRWLDVAKSDAEPFTIRSNAGYVACAPWWCGRCREPMRVVCLYCRHGSAFGERIEHFSVHHLRRADDALARRLSHWRDYRPSAQHGCYLNHCPRCATPWDDEWLHTEPDQPFFDVRHAAHSAVPLTRLQGVIRLCGDISIDA